MRRRAVDDDGVAIRTEGLTKHYGEVRALEDLDLDVRRGEVFGFLGPNGAGKTTTIRSLFGFLRPTRGSASILGLDVEREAVEIRRHTGYVPGEYSLYGNLTGAETLRFYANLRGGVDRAFVAELASRLRADLTRRVSRLSSGNRQKIGLIQAFMSRPEVLILDEPSTGLDPLMQQELATMIREVRDQGRTVFLSSHSLQEVERVADRVGILRDGRLLVVESVDDLKRRAIRRIELEFPAPVAAGPFTAIEGVREAHASDRRVTVSYEGPARAILARALEEGVLDLTTHETDLEEIFLAYYAGGGVETAAEPATEAEGRDEAEAPGAAR